MKTRTYLFSISAYVKLTAIFLVLSSMFSCTHKTEDAGTVTSPLGSFTRTFTGTETYSAQINLKSDGSFEWIMLDTLPTHTNSYSKVQVSGTQLRFYADPDFAGDGLYNWSLNNGVLNLSVVSDDYAARIRGIAGSWQIKDPAVIGRITGTWQKNMQVGGLSYRVKLTLTSAGLLKWSMVDSIPGYTSANLSFTATDNTMVIYNDPDCGGNGYYSFLVSDIAMSVIMVKDNCPPRSPLLSGTWVRLPSLF